MSGEYVLEPIDKDFTDDAVAEMRDYLENRLPTYRRSDGVYVLTPDVEYRDSVLRRGGRDEVNYSVHCIAPRTTGIAFSLMGDIEMTRKLADFMKWCQDRWRCELYGDGDGHVTVDQFLEIQLESELPFEEGLERSRRRAEERAKKMQVGNS